MGNKKGDTGFLFFVLPLNHEEIDGPGIRQPLTESSLGQRV